MKLLRKLLLVNWHYISHQLIELDKVNFLTGKNASGKSTIIDGLQVLILGDTSGYFFNQAANDNSRRTLTGYLKGELADDGSTGFYYLRDGTFSSYLAAEFYDTAKQRSLTAAVVFDVYKEEKPAHRFFILEGGIPANHFLLDNTPMNYTTLRAYLKNSQVKHQFFDTNKSYQQTFRARMGSLNEKFSSLFKKSVPFSPIMDIEKFISEFVCDVSSKIDITDMQDNIRYYKQLEQETEIVKERIERLEVIEKKFNDYQAEQRRSWEQSYLMDRSEDELTRNQIEAYHRQMTENDKQRVRLEDKLGGLKDEIKSLEERLEQLHKEKYNSETYKKSERLTERKTRLQEEINRLEDISQNLLKKLKATGYQWRENVNTYREKIISGSNAKSAEDWCELNEHVQYLAALSDDSIRSLAAEHLRQAQAAMRRYRGHVERLYYTQQDKLTNINQRLDRLGRELDALQQGLRPYDAKLLELQQEIKKSLAARYGREVGVDIFCELMEIKDKRWQDAIEGYLHTQKFYLIVEPQYFVDALKVYDSLKFERKLYNIGLVDIGKLLAAKPRSEPGSLAEEIKTDNAYARVYADYLLGRVIKCEQVEQLREYHTAVTPTGMLYRNFTARQLDPRRWEIPYIGKRSIKAQIEIKKRQQQELELTKNDIDVLAKVLGSLKDTEPLTDGEIGDITRRLEEMEPYPIKKEQYRQVVEELGRLDLSSLMDIDRRINEVKDKKAAGEEEKTTVANRIQVYKTKNETIENEKLPEMRRLRAEKQQLITERYPARWVDETGEPRFNKELEKRQSPQAIIEAFASQLARTKSQTDRKWKDLVAARAEYTRDYKMAHDVTVGHNRPFAGELEELKETHLSSYLEKIQDAQEKAQTQFQEDFVSKLKQNIDAVREQIGELNAALKDVVFGRDSYRFDVKPNPYYRKYYDMITDDMLLEGFNLFSTEFQSKHRDAIDELFKQIVDVGEGGLTADQRSELEKNIEKFTDYRTYLNFDLIQTDESGRESRLSRVINKKSGGETQTPFYISVLASFHRLYRVKQGRGQSANTLRLIVFDEAFNKMDHQRIQESIKLLRSMGLQAIISAPTEKIGDIAPVVDRNLCVTRAGGTALVKAFDPREVLEA